MSLPSWSPVTASPHSLPESCLELLVHWGQAFDRCGGPIVACSSQFTARRHPRRAGQTISGIGSCREPRGLHHRCPKGDRHGPADPRQSVPPVPADDPRGRAYPAAGHPALVPSTASGAWQDQPRRPWRRSEIHDENWYVDAWSHLRNDLRSFAINKFEISALVMSSARDISVVSLFAVDHVTGLDALCSSVPGVASGLQQVDHERTPAAARLVVIVGEDASALLRTLAERLKTQPRHQRGVLGAVTRVEHQRQRAACSSHSAGSGCAHATSEAFVPGQAWCAVRSRTPHRTSPRDEIPCHDERGRGSVARRGERWVADVRNAGYSRVQVLPGERVRDALGEMSRARAVAPTNLAERAALRGGGFQLINYDRDAQPHSP